MPNESRERAGAAGEQREPSYCGRHAAVPARKPQQDREIRERQAAQIQPHLCGIHLDAARRAVREQLPRQRQRQQAKRRGDEEDRAPPEPLDQHAANTGPECGRKHDAEAEESHRAALLLRLEAAQDDDRGDRLQHTGGEPFGGAHRQYQPVRIREAAGDAAGQQQ